MDENCIAHFLDLFFFDLEDAVPGGIVGDFDLRLGFSFAVFESDVE